MKIIAGARGRRVAALALGVVAAGCQSPWVASWDSTSRPPAADVSQVVSESVGQSGSSLDAALLQKAIQSEIAALEKDPADYEALTTLAQHCILMGTGYTASPRAKRRLYREAMRCSELAMYTNRDFKRQADFGDPPWETCMTLTHREMSAMMAWVTAVRYDFKECMLPLTKAANIMWLERISRMVRRMEQIDEAWQNGAVPFSRGLYYYMLPASMGGSVERAAAQVQRATELGTDRLLYRWGCAKFFRVGMHDRDGFRADLEWVLRQNPDRMADDPYWKAYILRDARQLLRDTELYF
jgi:hypothetical protein